MIAQIAHNRFQEQCLMPYYVYDVRFTEFVLCSSADLYVYEWSSGQAAANLDKRWDGKRQDKTAKINQDTLLTSKIITQHYSLYIASLPSQLRASVEFCVVFVYLIESRYIRFAFRRTKRSFRAFCEVFTRIVVWYLPTHWALVIRRRHHTSPPLPQFMHTHI